jgi:uncharacterized coiled-coil protein SlyX
VTGWESASREELLELVAVQAATIEELTARVAELERRLGQNSSELLAAAVLGLLRQAAAAFAAEEDRASAGEAAGLAGGGVAAGR